MDWIRQGRAPRSGSGGRVCLSAAAPSARSHPEIHRCWHPKHRTSAPPRADGHPVWSPCACARPRAARRRKARGRHCDPSHESRDSCSPDTHSATPAHRHLNRNGADSPHVSVPVPCRVARAPQPQPATMTKAQARASAFHASDSPCAASSPPRRALSPSTACGRQWRPRRLHCTAHA